MVSKHSFGTAPDGTPVTVYELTSGPTSVRVMDFGATLLGVTVPDRTGTPADVVLGFGSLEGYLDNPACYGATIGPSANRTDLGEVTIGDTTYQLPKNDGPDQRNNLHTDLVRGLHKRVWHAETTPGTSTVTFTTTLEDGELGLPGRRVFSATYMLSTSGTASELTIRYGCETNAPTFVNMTSHTYFNLAGHGSGSVNAQLVSLDATDFLPIREDSVSNGEVRPVAGTPFDFRAPKPLGQDVGAADEQLARARGYDHCFCVNGFAEGAAPRHALHAEDPASGRVLEAYITTPGAHLYTGNWLGDEGAKDGASYTPRCGFAFEPEYWPDNMHHAEWNHPVCEPGRPYGQTIVYRFSAR